MKDLKEYLTDKTHSSKTWLLKNHFDVYNEVMEYCKNIPNLDYKQKLWHYQNQKPNNIICHNSECNNLVKFKRRWTMGYYTYCCQKCSVGDVELKKSLLNYDRRGKHSKEEKALITHIKEENRILRELKTSEKKKEEEEKKLYYNTISIEEYEKLTNNINGLYSREDFVKENMNHIYLLVIEHSKYNSDVLFPEKVYRFLNKIKETPKCPNCDNKVEFVNKVKGYHKYCSVSCSSVHTHNAAVETLIAKTGVSHPSLLPDNIIKRRKKHIETIENLIGPNSKLILYDYQHENLIINCDKCGEDHEMSFGVLGQRVYLKLDWRNCITHSFGTSNPENEIREYIKSIYNGELIFNSRNILSDRKEIDIYIPEFKIGIEHNGIYWHNELWKNQNYHHDKWKMADSQGIKLIQIYEDEWDYKKDIIKSRIGNLLGINAIKIYARKCIIKEVPFRDVKEFLISNHLQGSVNSSINYGLYYNDELVSLMTFGRPRKGMKYSSSKNVYELYRFCNKLNTLVTGGASRLFNHFIQENKEVDEIYSFSALEWPGTLYEKLGMSLKSVSKYSYWYVEKDLRFSRHNYTKQKLIARGYDVSKSESQILKELNIYKIYGPGNKTFVWVRNKL